jgi:long-chain-fatty-acid--CoA ligase ACSBG
MATSGQRRLEVISRQVLVASTVASEAGSPEEYSQYEPGTHFGVLPDYEHTIAYASKGLMSKEVTPARTLPDVLFEAAKSFPTFTALAVERSGLGPPALKGPGDAPALPAKDWKKWTWKQYGDDARRAAKAFMVLGVEQFGSVSIFGFNAPEWAISAFGAMTCGGKYVGIYLTDTPEQVQYKVAHSASTVIVIDGKEEFQNVSSTINDMPGLKAIVCWGMESPGDIKRSDGSVCRVLTWEQLMKLGDAEGSEQALEGRLKAQRPGHCIGIIYTSGTTGNPKAVMISHDSVICEGAVSGQEKMSLIRGFTADGARILSYLPLSHIAGGLMDLLLPVYFCGTKKMHGTIYFARPYDLKEMTLALRIGFVKPTLFLAVPRVFEKIQARMMGVAATITGLKKKIATWAKGKGLENARNKQLGGSGAVPSFHGLADKLILSKARQALGLDECKVFLTGAAPISIETLEYFGQLGMEIQNCYGMSECSGVTTMTSMSRNVFGTVGHGLTGLETKIFKVGPNGENVEVPRSQPGKVAPEDCQGEICYRGRHVMMGYMANPAFGAEHVKEIEEKTAGAIDKWGWLHSGDKGTLDTNGMLRITGRYKELIIGAGGENIAPVPVEENIKLLCPALSNVMMVGDNRKFNVAIVTLQAEGSTGEFPGGDNLTGVALNVNPKVTTISGAMKDPVWLKYIQDGIEKTNVTPTVCQNNAWKIQRFAIVPHDFSIQTGEFTATLKLKRSVAEEQWKHLIDPLYD